MKAVTFKLNTVLAGVVGAACLLAVLLRAFAPITAWLPNIDIPCLAAVSILAMVIDCYIDYFTGVKKPARCWALTAAMALLTFWLMPWAALRIGVIGAILFTVLAFLFGTIRERLLSGKSNVLTPACVGFVMYLACQCFMGILL